MANALYQTAVRELERFLPPRVVAQALHEGLAALGKTPDTLTPGDATTIIQKFMLPRLTRAQGGEIAQEATESILATLASVPVEMPALSLKGQTQAIELLQEALRPFNIYFEWSETQKLRAQLSLIESEHEAGRDASELISAAQSQLGVLRQKLSDQLSLQARELAILESSLQASRSLNTPKVRRLEHLLGLIRSAQEAQQRVPAEIERAHKLASELRAEKLQQLSHETRELRGLRESYSVLFELEPALAERLNHFEHQLEEETLLQTSLAEFRKELETTQETLRTDLEAEFQKQLAQTERPEERQLLTLALKILETTLPLATDVKQIRDFALMDSTAQLSEFHRLETEAEAYRDVPSALGQALATFLTRARDTLAQRQALPDLSEGWRLIAEAQAEQTRSAESFMDRLERVQTAAVPLLHLTSEDALSLRWRLQSLDMQIGAVHSVSPKRQAEIEDNLQTAESLIHTLQQEASTARSVATQLKGQALDDLLGFLSPVAAETPRSGATTLLEPDNPLQTWLDRQAEHVGITGLALFTESAETLVAGTLPSDAKTLQRAVRLTKRRADTLGTALGRGSATTLTLETPENTLVAFWLTRARSLVLVTRAPTWGGAARQHLEDALPELIQLLE